MRKSSSSDGPDLDRIAKVDLTTDSRLEELYRRFVSRRWITNTERSLLDFICYAEKALAEDTRGTPGKLFYSLVKAKEGRITNAQEDRALSRFPSAQRAEIVNSIEDQGKRKTSLSLFEESPLAGRNVGFLPAAMMSCFLPQKRQSSEIREWKVSHGRTALLVKAGEIALRDDPKEFRPCDLPAGYLPRLLMGYIVGQAMKRGSPIVDMGSSLREFLRRLDISVDGRAGRKLTLAVEDLAAASFLLGYWDEDGSVHSRYSRVVGAISFWIDKNERQLTFWTPELELSRDFFHQLQDGHQVPVDMDHLSQLTRSPSRLTALKLGVKSVLLWLLPLLETR